MYILNQKKKKKGLKFSNLKNKSDISNVSILYYEIVELNLSVVYALKAYTVCLPVLKQTDKYKFLVSDKWLT